MTRLEAVVFIAVFSLTIGSLVGAKRLRDREGPAWDHFERRSLRAIFLLGVFVGGLMMMVSNTLADPWATALVLRWRLWV